MKSFFQNKTVRIISFIALLSFVLIAGFGYGFLVGKFRVFPYQKIRNVQSTLSLLKGSLESEEVETIETILFPLTKKSYNNFNVDFEVFGGGLSVSEGRVFGVGAKGAFFKYAKGGEIDRLNVKVPMNLDAFMEWLDGNYQSVPKYEIIKLYFRVFDFLVRTNEGKDEVIVCYSFWNAEEEAKSIRVARLMVDDLGAYVGEKSLDSESEWEVLFEANPKLKFDERSKESWTPFNTDQSGGKLTINENGDLVVALGSFGYDGVDKDAIINSDTTEFGKVIKIDLESKTSSVYARGVRSPSGIHLDSLGNLWLADNGPRGGDELNLIKEGAHYGWPFVTYGTEYISLVWPLNEFQGRHLGFEQPTFSWNPSIGVSNLIDLHYPSEWKGDLMVSSMKTASLYRVRITDGVVRFVEPILIGERIRDLEQMDDGTVLLWLDTGQIMEIHPENVPDSASTIAMEAARNSSLIQNCVQCHSLGKGGSNAGTISLWGVLGRDIASTPFQAYTHSLKRKSGEWTADNLASFLKDPQAFAPGTTMPSLGLSDEGVEELLDYLEMLN